PAPISLFPYTTLCRSIFRRVKKGRFPIFGTGQTYYHPVYIDNLVDAFILAMEQGKGAGQAYIIADKEYFSIKELVQSVAKAIDRSEEHTSELQSRETL